MQVWDKKKEIFMYDNENLNPETSFIKSPLSGFWSEKVFVMTDKYEITGFVFMPKTGKKNRVLSDILNGEKRFVAIKNAEIKNRTCPEETEQQDFIHINLDSIILIRPSKEN